MDPEPEDEEQICSADSDEERSDHDADESGADGEEQEDDDDGLANSGWAEAMAKILAKKTPASRSAILLKNKELDRVKEKEKQEQLERKKQVITTAMNQLMLDILVKVVMHSGSSSSVGAEAAPTPIASVESELRLKAEMNKAAAVM